MAECSTCKAPIHWLKTKAGKDMAVNVPILANASLKLFDPVFHVSHFITCPDADEHRKPKAPAPKAQTNLDVVPRQYEQWRRDMMSIGKLKE